MSKKILFITIILCYAVISKAGLTALKPLLDAQKNNAVIDIPYGKYLLDTQNGGGYSFNNLSNVTINLNGSEIICNKASNVFTFSNCTNVTVKGFSVDFDPLLYTQGVITAVDAAKMWFEFVVDAGYPITNIEASRTQFFDSSTRELKRNSITTYSGSFALSAVAGNARKFRATKAYYWDAFEAVGDLVVLNCTGSGHAFYMYKCQDMSIENVTLYGAATFAFFENETNNSHYLNCKVTLKKNEPERTSTRLRSSNADGIHSKNAKKGPTIENCEVLYGGDDCIAINGAMYPIYAVDATAKTISVLSPASTTYLIAGDSAQFVSYAGKKLGVAKMEVTRSATPTSANISTFLTKYPYLQNNDTYTYGIQVRVNEVPAELAVGDIIYSRDKTGAGFVIKNNTVGHIRSRAILIKASDGEITGNTISDCEMGGILVTPEYDWMEAGFSSNLEIGNNTITNCMFGRSSTSGKAGAISVMCVGANRSIAPLGAYSNISIHNNTVKNCPRPCVVVTSVDGLNYFANTISPDLATIRTHGQTYGVPNNVDFWSKNVTLKSNTGLSTLPENKIISKNGKLEGLEDYIGCKLKIRTIDGKIMYNSIVNSHTIILSGFRKSIYILSVESDTVKLNQKILIR